MGSSDCTHGAYAVAGVLRHRLPQYQKGQTMKSNQKKLQKQFEKQQERQRKQNRKRCKEDKTKC
jgi:hypothetical protein